MARVRSHSFRRGAIALRHQQQYPVDVPWSIGYGAEPTIQDLRVSFIPTTWRWLQQLPRFLSAIDYRVEKLTGGGQAKDETHVRQLEKHRQRLAEIDGQRFAGRSDSALQEYFWMVQEYRVSLFAQRLGTSIKVSPQRLEQQWNQVLHPS